MKKLEELRKLDVKKLLEELKDAKKSLFKVKFEVENGQAKNHHHIGNYRKYVARIKTLLNNEKKQDEPKDSPKEESKKINPPA